MGLLAGGQLANQKGKGNGMYAIVIDGELKGQGLKAQDVKRELEANRKGERLYAEVAAFTPAGWIPVCVDQFLLAA